MPGWRLGRGSLDLNAVLLTLCLAALPPSAVADDRSEPPPDQGALRSYFSANGMLNRGLHQQAAAEYRTFLSQYRDHAKAPVARYGLAVCLYRLGDYEAAAGELQHVSGLEGFPFAVEVLAMLGQCHMAGEQYKPAVEVFERLLREHPKHELADDAAALLSEAHFRCGDYEEAIKQSERFARRWKDSPLRERVLLYWGLAHVERGEWPAATERLSELLEAYPEGRFRGHAGLLLAQCSERIGVIERAAQWYGRVLKQTDSPYRPDALLGLATLEQSRGNAEKAGELADRLLRDFPDSPLTGQALLLRGRTWFDQQDLPRAADLFQQARAKSDQLADQAAFWLAKCKLRTGEHAAAAEQLKQALQTYPKSELLAEMRYDRAAALVQAGDDQAALPALRDFRSKHPQHTMAPDALHLLATVEHRRRQFERSQEYCLEFLGEHPKHPLVAAARFLAAENEFLRGQYDAARGRYAAFLSKHAGAPQARQATYRLGLSLYRLERFDQALPPLTKAMAWAEAEPAFRPCYLALGDIHFQRGEWKQAESLLSRYLAGGLSVAAADDALLKLGLAQQRQGRHPDACQTFERLLKEIADTPQRLHARFELGQALTAAERWDDAQAAFEQVLSDGPGSRFAPYALNHLGNIALRQEKYEKAAQYFGRVLKSDPEPALAADALFQQGQALMAIRRFEEAGRAFGRLLKAHPGHARAAEAQARLALALARQDRPKKALAAIGQVDRAALDEALRHTLDYERAWCLRKLGRRDEARDAFRRLVEARTNGREHAYALLELAELEAGDKRCAAAVPLLRELRRRAAESDDVPADLLAQATYRLGLCEFKQGHHEQAAALLDEFVKEYPKHPLATSASFFCGEAHLRCGRHQKAVNSLTRVVEANPRDEAYGPALLRLGEALATLQRWDRSEQVFSQYLREFKDSEYWYQAQFGVGWARENQGRYDEALAAYRPVTERHKGPTAARAQFQIGECLFAKKQYDEAVRELLKVDILYAYEQWSAAALFEAGRCFEHMGKPVEAREQFKRVRKDFGQTEWGKLAAQRLAAVSGGALPGRGGGSSPTQP